MNAIKHARTSRGLMLKDAAVLLDTDAGNLSRIEQGRQQPSVKLAKRIVDLYGLTLEQVFDAATRPEAA